MNCYFAPAACGFDDYFVGFRSRLHHTESPFDSSVSPPMNLPIAY